MIGLFRSWKDLLGSASEEDWTGAVAGAPQAKLVAMGPPSDSDLSEGLYCKTTFGPSLHDPRVTW